MNVGNYLRARVLPVLAVAMLFARPVLAQESADSLSDSDLSSFQEWVKMEAEAEDRKATDTLLRKIVPSVDMETVEDRVSCMELDMPLVVNKTVCGFIHFFTVRKRNYTQTMLERKNYYFPIFEYYLRKHQLPDALKYLSIVESGLNFKARSRTGAVGLWQFMPGTGRDFYLAQDMHTDERQNPWLATEAACRFLKYLYGMFNDWELALAAYNCGPGNVQKAIRRSGKRGFWEIYNYLPQETRSYVPQFHAVVYSMNFAADHHIFPDPDSVLVTVPLDTFQINRAFDMAKLERMLGLPAQSLHRHNPTIRTQVFPGRSRHPLLVPCSHSSLLSQNLDCLIDSAAVQEELVRVAQVGGIKYRTVTVSRGQKVGEVASRYQVDPDLLCQINRIQGNRFSRSRRIRIPLTDDSAGKPIPSVAAETYPVRSREESQPAEGQHLVVKGEKLYQVAIRYGCTTDQLRRWNQLPSSRIAEGQILRVSEPDSASLAAAIRPTPGAESGQSPAGDCPPEPLCHEVKKGEGLYSLARRYHCSVEQVLAFNPGLDSRLREGQIIRFPLSGVPASTRETTQTRIPEGPSLSVRPVAPGAPVASPVRIYRVQKGDTLYSITRKFNNVTIRELMRLNKLKDRHIRPGQKLILG